MDRINWNTGTDELLCHLENRVAVITLNKPGKKNALGDVLTPAFRQTLLELENDQRVGCLMITGAGDAFCSGGDVSGMRGGGGKVLSRDERIEELWEKQITLTKRIYDFPKLTVAALPGAAAGAGLSIALACDLRIACKAAFITTAFANVGLSGDYGSSWFLPRIVGHGRAKELFYTARRVYAEEGREMGLINEVFPSDSFRQQAMAYVVKLANGPTGTLKRMKENLHCSENMTLEESLKLEARNLIESAESSEAREAITAFMEKRSPVFHT